MPDCAPLEAGSSLSTIRTDTSSDPCSLSIAAGSIFDENELELACERVGKGATSVELSLVCSSCTTTSATTGSARIVAFTADSFDTRTAGSSTDTFSCATTDKFSEDKFSEALSET